jgi:(S)-mandelate dehydrogenase
MAGGESRLASWRLRYPSLADLQPLARRRLPYFAHDFLQGGTGSETGSPRNAAALQAIEVVPRYATDISTIDTSVSLFGRSYPAPVVMSPIGMDGSIWPGATRRLAATARDTGLPYMTGTLATASLETVAEIAGDNLWFQLYSFPEDDHRVTFDLARRAEAAGAHVLAITVDIPITARRVRDMRNGLSLPMRISPKMLAAAVASPAWLAALARRGMPHLENLAPYCSAGARGSEWDMFVRNGRAGTDVTWDTIARIREKWPRAMVIKGIMHPADAERALALGLDGLVVSNHGGRQFDPAPATVDVVPAIRAAVGKRMQVLMDGGIMSGTDVLKALACGADAVLAGRAFMTGLAALGDDGAQHVAATLVDEFRIALGQTGACDVAGVSRLAVRHERAWRPEDFAPHPVLGTE